MNIFTYNKFYLLLCTLFLSVHCFSETIDTPPTVETETAAKNEWGLWYSVGLQKKWDNGVALELEQETRLRDNFTSTDKFMTTLGLSYKCFSFLKAGASYTMINYNHPGKKSTDNQEYWEMRRRYSLYLVGDYSYKRFNLSWKERYQSTYRVGLKDTSTRANPKALLRSKLTLAYNVKGLNLEPYVYCEWQHSLNDPAGKNGLVETRYAAGLDYKFDEGISLDCGYIYDIDKEGLVNTSVVFFGIGYSF